MSKPERYILWGLAVVVILALGAYFGARYLVSKLDGSTGGVSAPPAATELYSSEEGISFKYPDRYELSSRTEGNGEREWDILVFLPKGYVPPQGGEGPPTITLGIYPNPENLPLEQWVRGDNRSNYKLSTSGELRSGTIGGEFALGYEHSGLYETDAVAIAHKNKVFLFSAGYLAPTDQTRADLEAILATVEFTD